MGQLPAVGSSSPADRHPPDVLFPVSQPRRQPGLLPLHGVVLLRDAQSLDTNHEYGAWLP